ncbi:LPS export ABC transporter periplasmic protein LptC [Vibrio aphrogenes]|uniref:LPS export ABC transporter periplasmic protein LptC n=1 Tax=Vibrio aphrogenes TaxID=1891186 RepID=UPI000B34EA3D|nr:LPS export ABC transporter periplasmic protein LptC [Vibrio aphrogenes]
MSMSRLIYLLLFFVACWSGYYLYEQSADDVEQTAPSLEAPMFTGKNLYNTSYDETGLRNYKIHSDSLEHFAQDGHTVFYSPKLIVYREGNTEEWVITADNAVLNKEHVLTLQNNVLARNVIPGSSLDRMTTDKMIIDLDSKDFSSDTPVTMIGPQFINTGNAMTGNFATNIATLFNQVQGTYENITP